MNKWNYQKKNTNQGHMLELKKKQLQKEKKK